MKYLLIALLSIASFNLVSAQTVEDIISKHVAAIGGKEKLDKIENVVMNGNLIVQGTTIKITVTGVQNKLLRQDIEVMGIKSFEYMSDTEGWSYQPLQGMKKKEMKLKEEVKEGYTDLDLTGPLYNYKAKGYTINLLPNDKVNERECYTLGVNFPSGKAEIYWIDLATFMVLRSAEKKQVNGEEKITVVDYADYKDVNGVKMPFTLVQSFGTITFSSIKMNEKLDSRVYSPNEL